MLFSRKKKPKASNVPPSSFCVGSEGALRLWVAEFPRTELQLCVDRLMVCGQELLMMDWPVDQKLAALTITDEVITTTTRGLERQSATASATTEQILSLFQTIQTTIAGIRIDSSHTPENHHLCVIDDDYSCYQLGTADA